jgi:tetratricopeptide (TPR) repeat protein
MTLPQKGNPQEVSLEATMKDAIQEAQRQRRILLGANIVCFILIAILAYANIINAGTLVARGKASATIQSITADEAITLTEITDLVTRAETAESRAFGYLGFFEAIGLSITVLGILAAIVGLVLGGGVREAQQRFLDSQQSMSRLEEANNKLNRDYQATIDNLTKQIQDLSAGLQSQVNDITKKSNIAQFYVVLARTQAALGDFDGAIDTYERAKDLIPENPVPYYHIGYILTQRNRFDEANEILKEALNIDGKFANAKAALGFVSRRRWDRLKSDIEQGKEEDSVENRKRLEDYAQKAKAQIEAALYDAPSLVDDDGESWHGSLAGLYRRQKDLTAAAHHYKLATQITPQSSYPLLNFILVNWEQGNTANLLSQLNKVHDLVYSKIKKDKDTYWDRADFMNVQLALGINDEALVSLETFLQVLPVSAKDVLPRVISSSEFILDAVSFDGDKRDKTTIISVIEKLKAERESREKEA